MPAKWYEFKNLTATSADLYFYGDIVGDYWESWQEEDQYPEKVKNFLSGVEGKDLNIYINSGGGSVFAGIAIYNMIKRHAEKNSVKVYVDGLAGSIASIIAFAGNVPPSIPSNAFIMIHNPWAAAAGNAGQLRKIADDLDVIREGILNIYAEHLAEGATIEQVEEMMNAETWLNGQQAAEVFAVETAEAKDYVAKTGEYNSICRKIPEEIAKGAGTDPEETAARAAIRDIMIDAYCM